ncbi:MAG TPA: PAS domain S-box protein, partial [Chloroflexi bacterium]|nr:PAS domain S-box protein [Chloroflexota bacterium]
MERRTRFITFPSEDPRFLAALLDSMVDMVIVANPDGTIKAVNRAVLDILGYEPEELIGENVGKIFAVEVEVEVEVEVFKGTSLSQLVKEGALRDVRMTLLSKAGEKVPALVSGSVVRDEEGKLLGVMVIAHDLRKLERLMAELEAIRGLGRELVLAADKERIIKMTLETATKVLHF